MAQASKLASEQADLEHSGHMLPITQVRRTNTPPLILFAEDESRYYANKIERHYVGWLLPNKLTSDSSWTIRWKARTSSVRWISPLPGGVLSCYKPCEYCKNWKRVIARNLRKSFVPVKIIYGHSYRLGPISSLRKVHIH